MISYLIIIKFTTQGPHSTGNDFVFVLFFFDIWGWLAFILIVIGVQLCVVHAKTTFGNWNGG